MEHPSGLAALGASLLQEGSRRSLTSSSPGCLLFPETKPQNTKGTASSKVTPVILGMKLLVVLRAVLSVQCSIGCFENSPLLKDAGFYSHPGPSYSVWVESGDEPNPSAHMD